MVRFAGSARNGIIICGFRIDADCLEPDGGFRPVKVTYEWSENGTPKQAAFTARRPQASWKVHCAAKPVMKRITLEIAD